MKKKKITTFALSSERHIAFETLKSTLTSPPTLAFTKDMIPFFRDAADSASEIGTVLSQEGNGHDPAIAYCN